MRTWYVDESRDQFALWFGEFASADKLKRFAIKEFLQQLQIPMSSKLEAYYLETCFTTKRGDLAGLIGALRSSQSYLQAVQKAARKRRISRYNGAIALFDYFTDEDISKDVTGAEYFGLFKYDIDAEKIVPTTPYINDKRVSVWFGSFPSKVQFESYFNLPDHVPPEEDFDWVNGFAEDFKIPTYEQDFTAYNLSRAMRPKSFADLISAIPMSPKLLKSMVKAAAEQQVSEGNAVYVAFGLDYDNLKSSLKKKPRSRFDFKYIGTFDDPGQPMK